MQFIEQMLKNAKLIILEIIWPQIFEFSMCNNLKPTVAKLQSHYRPPEAGKWNHTSQDYLLFILHQSQPLSLSFSLWESECTVAEIQLWIPKYTLFHIGVMLHDILFWKVVILTILLKGLEIERSYVSKWVSCGEVGLRLCISLLCEFSSDFHANSMDKPWEELHRNHMKQVLSAFLESFLLLEECWDVEGLSSVHLRGR